MGHFSSLLVPTMLSILVCLDRVLYTVLLTSTIILDLSRGKYLKEKKAPSWWECQDHYSEPFSPFTFYTRWKASSMCTSMNNGWPIAFKENGVDWPTLGYYACASRISSKLRSQWLCNFCFAQTNWLSFWSQKSVQAGLPVLKIYK